MDAANASSAADRIQSLGHRDGGLARSSVGRSRTGSGLVVGARDGTSPCQAAAVARRLPQIRPAGWRLVRRRRKQGDGVSCSAAVAGPSERFPEAALPRAWARSRAIRCRGGVRIGPDRRTQGRAAARRASRGSEWSGRTSDHQRQHQAAASASKRFGSSTRTPSGTITISFSRSSLVKVRLTVSIVRPRKSAMS